MSEVILKRENGTISVLLPTSSHDIEKYKEDADCRVVNSEDLPSDRTFRDAWTIDGTIDLYRAKEIWMDKIRHAREQRLKELDIPWMKAMEKGHMEEAASIARLKQELRDITKREELTQATSIEEIKSFWPDILKG